MSLRVSSNRSFKVFSRLAAMGFLPWFLPSKCQPAPPVPTGQAKKAPAQRAKPGEDPGRHDANIRLRGNRRRLVASPGVSTRVANDVAARARGTAIAAAQDDERGDVSPVWKA